MREPEAQVLVSEDEPVVCRAVERILASVGLVAAFAATLEEALARLASGRFRILLCDLMLPDGSGFDVLAAARERQPGLQTIVITGYATADNAVRSLGEGAFDYLPKPFDWTELLGVVDRAMRYRQRILDSEGSFDEASPGPDPGPGVHWLGGHSWARIDHQGSAKLGPAETFFETIDGPTRVQLPGVGSHISQGRCLARLRCSGEREHRVWSPLSGVVLEINSALQADPTPIRRDPFGTGWLATIASSRTEQEIPRLWRRGADSTAAPAPTDTS